MEMLPTKESFIMIFEFPTLGVTKGTQVSQILTNGCSRPRYLLICLRLQDKFTELQSATDGSTVTGGASVGTP